MNKEFLEKQKTTLQKQKERLEQELESFATKDPSLKGDWDTKFPVEMTQGSNDPEEAAGQVEAYSTELETEFTLETQLRDVQNAIEKIGKGAYGVCENCGKPISQERLEASPEAKLCLNCQK